MPKRSAKRQADFKHTWYLQEWMQQADPPRKQADLIKGLGWSRAKAHDVWHGQQYTQELIDELAPWLRVRPYELLMPPDFAMGIRRQVDDAARIVSNAPATGFEHVDAVRFRLAGKK